VRMITPNGEVSTLAGSAMSGFADGNGRDAKFKNLCGLAYEDENKSLLVCDCANNSIRRISMTGKVTTICAVESPTRVAITSDGIILVVSGEQNKIFKVTQETGAFEVTRLAGTGKKERKDGSADECSFDWPSLQISELPPAKEITSATSFFGRVIFCI